eukprot:CAMPEP_0202729314 /NCGR_PEP_ID=MMETSP1385-20130828/186067_1 /ASSEMBLY_ACC=CAM_ASM_000861 /TAXON_ID=933848 /ORGANISM="Elphidium margaritaceum" /LENGTH=393 /DNA_ID=CAMNT_0049395573 /DNA_START=763 /DNA_END=1944 /DNA_ORIENTATION=+
MSTASTVREPTRKKRKINYADEDDPEEEYIPNDSNDDGDDDEYAPPSNKENEMNESKTPTDDEDDADDDDNDMDYDLDGGEDDGDQSNANSNSNSLLSPSAKKSVRDILNTLSTFKAAQLKAVLNDLKALRTIDGECVFEDTKSTGKKDEIYDRVKRIIAVIYAKKVVVRTGTRFWATTKDYSDSIDVVSWKSRISQSLKLNASKDSKSKKNSVIDNALRSRLNACNKSQIIDALEMLFNEQSSTQQGSELAQQLAELLPRPSLQDTFARHKTLINAIYKAVPNTRWGSSRDDYSFKRCRGSVNTAKKTILQDGKRVMDSKEWNSCLEFLIVTSKNIDEFPTWNSAGNNTAKQDLKKKCKLWHEKVKKELGANISDTQKKQLQQLTVFFAEKE